MNKKDDNSISLDRWILEHNGEDELKDVFLNMDVALKYIHEHGYCVEVFYPSMIEILNNSINQIQFTKLMPLPKDGNEKINIIREDLFNSSFVQIGIYSNSLNSLNPDFLRNNFDSFVKFIPNDIVPYYRGVVQRGASVYLCDYIAEKNKRDLEHLEVELAGEGQEIGKQMVKDNGHNIGIEPLSNNKINDRIYQQINNLKDSAFIRVLVLPTIVLLCLLLFSAIQFVISYFQ